MPIYFVRQDSFVKIGYSGKPMKRIGSLQTANPHELDILLIMPGNSATEKEFHSVFTEYHHLNEWYRYEGELRKFVESTADIFANYTLRYEMDNTYLDERDWEYWRARALEAESKLSNKHTPKPESRNRVQKVERGSLPSTILEVYRDNPLSSYSDLVNKTGWSKGTIFSEVNSLIERGQIKRNEQGIISLNGATK